jgi:predicted DNA-binding protein
MPSSDGSRSWPAPESHFGIIPLYFNRLDHKLDADVDNTGTGIYGHAWSNRSPPNVAKETRTAPMSRKKISTTIYITPEQNDRLKLLHERTKVPIAVYIREGIDMVLKHYEHVLPGQMSLEAAGQKKS